MKRRCLWTVVTLILLTVLVVGVRQAPPLPLQLIASYQIVTTQTVASIMFTNTTGKPLLCGRNSTVHLVATDGEMTRAFNNNSTSDPLLVQPGQVGSYSLSFPTNTIRFQVTTEFISFSWRWLPLWIAPTRLIPDSLARKVQARFERTSARFALRAPEIEVKELKGRD
jgi:hypothetical protein